MTYTSTIQRLLFSAASALVLSSAPAAVYAHGGDVNLIHACATKTSGAVRIIAPTSTCKNGEFPLDWNFQGPIGPQGLQGVKGDKGDIGATGATGPAGSAFPISCPADSVLVGTTCVDTYEASVWQIPSGSTALIDKVKNGTATLADLQAGGFQKGATTDDYTCNDNGNDCTDLYAASVSGVTPSARLTWFQAQQFCRAAGKRLLINAEWQSAAAGTPDGTSCVVSASGAGPTGTAGCVSNAGAFDMVGNLNEWVGDWMQDNSNSDGGSTSSADYGTDGIFGIDEAFPETDRLPAALIRGGDFNDGTSAGVFALGAVSAPSSARPPRFSVRPLVRIWSFGPLDFGGGRAVITARPLAPFYSLAPLGRGLG